MSRMIFARDEWRETNVPPYPKEGGGAELVPPYSEPQGNASLQWGRGTKSNKLAKAVLKTFRPKELII